MVNSWYVDKESPRRWIQHLVKKWILKKKTAFQTVDLIDTYNFGLMILLDNKIQSTEADEFIYHESLVHPALLAHPQPRKVLLLGGGEGAALREVLRHPTIEKAVMVDIDEEFISISRDHLQSWHQGAFKNSRAKLVFEDALGFIMKEEEKFDVILADLSDPIKGGPSVPLYTREFYEYAAGRLADSGLLVTQATEVFCGREDIHTVINHTMASVFPHVATYCEYIPSFGSMWGFAVASHHTTVKDMDAGLLKNKIKERELTGLRYYDAITHQRLFHLPLWLRKSITEQKKVSTMKTPVYSFSNE
ncbi:MAG: polyamine aminopropyltransferase [Candidatus Aminicenantes bacterium]|nr:polyamine aminopropyltransferase [Candidatus Aminicenantes bacterium]